MATVRTALLVAAALTLAACGSTPGDRAATGAIIGAGTGGTIGLAFGGVGAGAFVGAAVGAGVGVLTKPSQLDLGKPVWR